MIRTLLCLLALPLILCAETPNAAPFYLKAIEETRAFTPEEKTLFSAACGKELTERAIPFLIDEARALVDNFAAPLATWEAATGITSCDWGNDASKGIGGYSYSHGKIGNVTRIALVRARLRTADGDIPAALEDYRRILATSRAITEHEQTIIAHLVGISIESSLIYALSADLAKFDESSLHQLDKMLLTVPSKWRQLPAILANETAMLRVEQSRRPPAYLASSVSPALTERFKLWLQGITLKLKDSSEKKQIAKVIAFYEKQIPLLSLPAPQALEQIEAANADLQKRSPSPLVRDSASAVSGVPKMMLHGDILLDLLRTAIAIRLKGPDAVATSRDPFTGQPYRYEEKDGGFTLSSEITHKEKPATLFFPPSL